MRGGVPVSAFVDEVAEFAGEAGVQLDAWQREVVARVYAQEWPGGKGRWRPMPTRDEGMRNPRTPPGGGIGVAR
jgi:hypothetical protein